MFEFVICGILFSSNVIIVRPHERHMSSQITDHSTVCSAEFPD